MSPEVTTWLFRQCEIQHATTESDIAGMQAAWIAAVDGEQTVTINVIKGLGNLIDPVANPGGRFRSGPAVFLNGGSAAKAADIEYYLVSLMRFIDTMTPAEFYRELMWIHPFKDGNGRMGALVYNMLNGTIDNPIDPPEYS
jgi:hypothetical protein